MSDTVLLWYSKVFKDFTNKWTIRVAIRRTLKISSAYGKGTKQIRV